MYTYKPVKDSPKRQLYNIHSPLPVSMRSRVMSLHRSLSRAFGGYSEADLRSSLEDGKYEFTENYVNTEEVFIGRYTSHGFTFLPLEEIIDNGNKKRDTPSDNG